MYIVAYLVLIISLIFIVINMYRIGNARLNSIQQRLGKIQLRMQGIRSTSAEAKSTPNSPINSFIAKLIEQFGLIGVEISAKEIMLLNVISYVVLFLIIFLLNKNIMVACIVGSVGLFVPYLVVSHLVRQRFKQFEKLFGDAMALIANTLKAGFSLKQAMQIVARDMPEPINEEFQILNQELDWGLSLGEAMKNLSKRVPNEHVALFVTAILIQNEVGGSLADIVGKISETISTKEQIRGELKVLTAQGKISGIIVGLMPFAIGGFISVLNPAYVAPLFTTPIGLILVGAAIFLELFGVLVIRLIVNLE